jgi:hypothetical protein
VLLRRRGRLPIELQAGSTEEGRGLLRALGLDASQTVAHFRTLSRALAKRRHWLLFGMGFAAFWLGLVNSLATRAHMGPSGATILVCLAGLVAALSLLLAPARLSVGADGIAIRWLWTKRFLGYDEIREASRYEKGVGRSHVSGIRIILRSSEEVLVPVNQGSMADPTSVALIEERIREAAETFRRGDAAADAALLQRGDRPVAEWVSALRSIGTGANADMRTAPVPRERLFRIVEDPASAAADRAAAAVALGGDLDDDGRARLRSAALATAAPKLRVAIEKAAAGGDDEAELSAALAELEEEDARRERA